MQQTVASDSRDRLEDELKLIDELGLAGFFLLHHEVLSLARECASEVRGTGTRELPASRPGPRLVRRLDRLLPHRPLARRPGRERALARAVPEPGARVRAGHRPRLPADIREKLIVRVTERYGREHAALVASFATYRSRGAIRDVGKALGPVRRARAALRLSDGWDARRVGEELARLPGGERKLGSRRWRAFAWLTGEIAGLPRHVSQHPGGMIVSTRPLVELVPVQPAAMAGRQLCQWDKDSCSDAGFLKIDLLGPGCSPRSRTASTGSHTRTGRSSTSHGSPSTIPRSSRRSSARTRSARSRSRAARRCRASCAPNRGPRRPHCAGRARPPGADPGEGGAPVHRRPGAAAGKPSYVWPVDHEDPARAAAFDVRRRRLPGPGARGRDRARRVHCRGSRGAAPRDEPQAQP